jgi:Arc/MetJ-type ribon-helix-helix transcriptional regulator
MRKTTVYLSEEEAEALRRVAARTGRSQAELIREGVRRVTRPGRRRVFHSMGAGEGPGEPIGRMSEEILEREWGTAIDHRR